MIISIDFQESLIDNEMNEYIKLIEMATGWTKEKIIKHALSAGSIRHIKRNLEVIANGIKYKKDG